MSLRAFIRDHQEEIIVEFATFARTLMPTGGDMSEAELRDHAHAILTAIVDDMGTTQTGQEEARKSKGHGAARTMRDSGKLHADDRISHGFTFRSVLAEFRALRATVLRLYEEHGGSDLSEVRRFNEAIDEALTESMHQFAETTDLFRDQFIGILSHDLRTPLGAVINGATLLAESEDNPQLRGRVVTRVMRSAQRMKRLIGDLLDLTHARLGGTIPVTRRTADLQKICEDVVMENRSAHPEAVLRFTSRGNLAGNWDADRLTQVVANLVGNAIQHGDRTPVTLTAEGDDDAVTITVHNGGAPIPPHLQSSVFEPLARGGGEQGMHSIGLGLYIARAIASAHGGHIDVRSSSEHGTTFTVWLPKSDAAESATSAAVSR